MILDVILYCVILDDGICNRHFCFFSDDKLDPSVPLSLNWEYLGNASKDGVTGYDVIVKPLAAFDGDIQTEKNVAQTSTQGEFLCLESVIHKGQTSTQGEFLCLESVIHKGQNIMLERYCRRSTLSSMNDIKIASFIKC